MTENQTEGLLIAFDDEKRQVRPWTRAVALIDELNKDKTYHKLDKVMQCEGDFHQEVGSFNLETIPSQPWTLNACDLLALEEKFIFIFKMMSSFLRWGDSSLDCV